MATLTQAQIDAGQNLRLDKLEGIKPAPVPAPTPPPGEGPVAAPVLPTVVTAPGFGPGPYNIGSSITRIPGTYKNGVGVAGRRYRNNVLIAGATSAAYTIMTEDLGQSLVFEEEAEGPLGVRRWFKSAAIKPIAAPPAAAGTQASINDMKLKNDFVLKGYENRSDGWYASADVGMGAHPYIDATSTATWSWIYNHPKYWGQACRAALPWTAIYEGTGNRATNTAIEIADAMFFLKSKATGKWRLVSGPVAMGGEMYSTPNSGVGGRHEEVLSRGTNSSVIKAPPAGLFWHGWGSMVDIDPADVAAVQVRIKARLVGSDIDKAQYGMQVGLDYYVSSSMRYTEAYAPSAFISRTRFITKDFQVFTGTSLRDLPVQNPGNTGITCAELTANPPPA